MLHIPKLKLIDNTIQLTYETLEIPARYLRASAHDSTPSSARLRFVDSDVILLPRLKDGIVTFDVPQGTSLEEVYIA